MLWDQGWDGFLSSHARPHFCYSGLIRIVLWSCLLVLLQVSLRYVCFQLSDSSYVR